MRRKFLFQSMLWAITLVMVSCQKEDAKYNTNDEIISKINSWLDSKKPTQKPTQAVNVELLKQNILISELRIEQSADGERIVIIPVTEAFKAMKKIDPAAIPNLVLIEDKTGKIRKGNIVLFYPQNGYSYKNVPHNTFYDILNTAKPDCNGKIRYLSITGKRLHELEYENGHLKSFAHAKDSGSTSARVNNCVDWYWVTTYYNSDGEVINETWDYIATTCQGEDCEDPYNAMLCPMDASSGGGTGDDQAYEYAVSRPWKWGITYTSNWNAESYETVTGIKNSNEPQGGHFTGIGHVSSYFTVSNPGYTWQELGNTVSVDNPQKVYSSTTGKAIAPNNTYNIYSRSTDNRFDLLFP